MKHCSWLKNMHSIHFENIFKKNAFFLEALFVIDPLLHLTKISDLQKKLQNVYIWVKFQACIISQQNMHLTSSVTNKHYQAAVDFNGPVLKKAFTCSAKRLRDTDSTSVLWCSLSLGWNPMRIKDTLYKKSSSEVWG